MKTVLALLFGFAVAAVPQSGLPVIFPRTS
jgi:hypothetical protein